MNWIQRMNWSFLETEDAEKVWDEARRLYFENDYPINTAFKEALNSVGIKTNDRTSE